MRIRSAFARSACPSNPGRKDRCAAVSTEMLMGVRQGQKALRMEGEEPVHKGCGLPTRHTDRQTTGLRFRLHLQCRSVPSSRYRGPLPRGSLPTDPPPCCRAFAGASVSSRARTSFGARPNRRRTKRPGYKDVQGCRRAQPAAPRPRRRAARTLPDTARTSLGFPASPCL